MKFGNIILQNNPLFLAPMEDVTDSVFRSLIKAMGGVDFMFTEFISSDGLIRNGKKSINKLNIRDEERPIGIQIYGHVTESMVLAAKMAEEAKPDVIDINFGCPVKKIANRGAGSGMMRNVPLMLEITESIVKAVKIPVTVKTRLGWDENTKNILEIAEKLQDKGIVALTVHGRTRSQMYKGKADWTLIKEIKNNPRINIPIIGNGDIDSPISALNAFDNYGVDGVMIGRAAVGQPWLFKQIRNYLDTGILTDAPSIKERVEIAKHHLNISVNDKGERAGVITMRRHYVQYFKGIENFRETRIKLLRSLTYSENIEILDYIADNYS